MKQYYIYLPRLRDMWYNLGDEEKKDFALLLSKSYEEMEKIAKGNKEREEVVKFVRNLGKDCEFMEFTDKEEFEKALRDVTIEEKQKAALRKAKKMVKNKEIEMIKSMHENEASLEFIAKVTKTSVKKVKEILGLY